MLYKLKKYIPCTYLTITNDLFQTKALVKPEDQLELNETVSLTQACVVLDGKMFEIVCVLNKCVNTLSVKHVICD